MPTPDPTPDSLPRSAQTPTTALYLIIMLLGVFSFIQVWSVQSILPELQRDMHATVVEIGNAVGMTVLAIALVSPFIGMLSDALGRRWLIITCVFVMAAPTFAMAWVQSVDHLLLLRFLQGLAVPGVTVVAIAYIGEEFSGASVARAMTFYIAGNVLGGFSGRFLMGHLTEFMDWRTAFVIMAVLNVMGGAAVWRVLPASRRFVADRRFSSNLRKLWELLHNPYLLSACALGFTVMFALVGVFTYVNLHLAAAPYFFDSGQLANIFAVYLVGVVVTPMAGRYIPRLGARRTILMSVVLAASGIALTLVQPAWGIIAALILASSGTFITQSATMSFIAYRITAGRSLATGLYYTSYYVGGFTGAWLGGLAYTWGAWQATVAVLVAVQFVGWLIAWGLMPPTKPPQPTATSA